jgi:hypothetical protein
MHLSGETEFIGERWVCFRDRGFAGRAASTPWDGPEVNPGLQAACL